jgi:hypothetical protein
MRRLALPLAAIAAVSVLIVACQEDRSSPTSPVIGEPAGLISDGSTGGNEDFFFLPPLLPNPSRDPNFGDKMFNAYLSPRVEICQLDAEDGSCLSPQPPDFPIIFTMHDGPGSVIQVEDEHYHVNWHTDVVQLNTTAFYRIQVFGTATALLGFADVDPIESKKELKNLKTSESIPLKDGRTMPIKFRIEEGAICNALLGTLPGVDCSDATAQSVGNEGGTTTVPSKVATGVAEPNWLDAVIEGGGPEEVTFIITKVNGNGNGGGGIEQISGPCFPTVSMEEEPACYQYTTDPELGPYVDDPFNVWLEGQVIAAQCINQAVIDEGRDDEFMLFQYDPDFVGLPEFPNGIKPLPTSSAADGELDCTDFSFAQLGDSPLARFARASLQVISQPLAKLFGPEVLFARHKTAGMGGLPTSFSPSNIGWARALEMSGTAGSLSGYLGVALNDPITIDIIEFPVDPDAPGEKPVPVDGVPVTFSVPGNGVLTDANNPGSSGNPLTINTVSGESSVIWTLASNLPAGDQVLTAQAAAYNGPVTFTATANELPDLIVETLTHSPTNPTTSDNILFTAVVKNVGVGPATPSTLMFKIGGETPGFPATLFAVPALDPGETYTAERQLSLMAQGYINTATADYNDDVPESDETNNTTTDTYSVTEAAVVTCGSDFPPTLFGQISEFPADAGLGNPDLECAAAGVVGTDFVVYVKFVSGTFNDTTFTDVHLDTDQNTATGWSGIDASNNDSALMGTDFIIRGGANTYTGTTAEVWQGTGPNTLVKTADVAGAYSFFADGFTVTIPLSDLGSDDGILNFKVTTALQLSAASWTGIKDYLTDVGTAPGTVN